MADPTTRLPNIGETIGPILLALPRERQPLFVALAERMAAERYRGWAADCAEAAGRTALLACAGREEEIARRVEALYPAAAAIQRGLIDAHPDLEAINQSIFAGRSREEQYAIQAGGERLGAATWRSFAREVSATAREVFLRCAELEEESAAVLESLLGQS